MTEEKLEKSIEELTEAANWEGTEVGDMWNTICSLYEFSQGYFSDKFERALKAEIIHQYEEFKTNYEFIEEERQEVVKTRVRELVYKG